MQDYRVYVPTRGRIPNVLKVVPRWLAAGFDVVLVTDPREKLEHIAVMAKAGYKPVRGWQEVTGESGVTVIAPERPNGGFGYQCNFAFEHAKSEGLGVYVVSDDDLMPKAQGYSSSKGVSTFDNVQLLVDEMRARPDYLGISVVRDYHNFATKGAVAEHFGEVVINASGWQQCYAVNVAKLDELGGYDVELTCHGEGHELIRQSIAQLRRPWLMHCGVYMQPLGKRYDAGGLNDWAREKISISLRKPASEVSEDAVANYRTMAEMTCQLRIQERWPDFVSSNGNNRWRKLHDYYLPGWETFSALHGGGSIDDIEDYSIWEGNPA
jgi:hypothetical protein